MSKENFAIFYEGSEYDTGEMDIEKFAPSLLAFGHVLKMANHILNQDQTALQISIKENIENKCFKANLGLYAKNLLDNLSLLLGMSTQHNINTLLEVIGFIEAHPLATTFVGGVAVIAITNYIDYKKWERGRKVESFIEIEEGNFKIKIGGEEKFVTKTLGKILKATWKDKKAKPLFKTLQEHLMPSGEKKYQLNKDSIKTLPYADLENLMSQTEDLNIIENADSQEILTDLKIRMPDLEGKKRWEFNYTGTTITPNYGDEIKDFLMKLRNESFPLKGCSIPVKLRIDFAKDDNDEKVKGSEKFTILEIMGEVKRPIIKEQENLF